MENTNNNTNTSPDLCWSEDYRTGHDPVDRQHQQLFLLLAKLQDALHNCHGNAVARRALLELIDYSRHHFSDEEQFMRRLGFPGLAQHQLEHAAFIDEIKGLLDELDMGQPVLTVELVYFIKHWLTEHILTSDMKIRDYQKLCANHVK